MREFLEQLFQMAFRHATCSSSSSGSSSSSSQARGKGVASEAGPWHGAAGLRVKPERAALRRRLVAIAVAAMPPQAVPFARLVCILGHPLARQAASARLRIGAEVDRMT